MSTLKIYPGAKASRSNSIYGRFVSEANGNDLKVSYQLQQHILINSRVSNVKNDSIAPAGHVYELAYNSNASTSSAYWYGSNTVGSYILISPITTFLNILLFSDKPEDTWFDVPLSLNGISPPFNYLPDSGTINYATTSSDLFIYETPVVPGPGTSVKIKVIDNPTGVLTYQKTLTAGTNNFVYGEQRYTEERWYVDSRSSLSTVADGTVKACLPQHVRYFTNNNTWEITTGLTSSYPRLAGYTCICGTTLMW